MDKKIAGLAGAITSLASMHAAEASPAQNVAEIVSPRSYAELLQPIPNAAALLKAVDAAAAVRAEAEAKRNANVRLAQYWDYYYPHHHHHHNYYYQRPYYHHHHHHHHIIIIIRIIRTIILTITPPGEGKTTNKPREEIAASNSEISQDQLPQPGGHTCDRPIRAGFASGLGFSSPRHGYAGKSRQIPCSTPKPIGYPQTESCGSRECAGPAILARRLPPHSFRQARNQNPPGSP